MRGLGWNTGGTCRGGAREFQVDKNVSEDIYLFVCVCAHTIAMVLEVIAYTFSVLSLRFMIPFKHVSPSRPPPDMCFSIACSCITSVDIYDVTPNVYRTSLGGFAISLFLCIARQRIMYS